MQRCWQNLTPPRAQQRNYNLRSCFRGGVPKGMHSPDLRARVWSGVEQRPRLWHSKGDSQAFGGPARQPGAPHVGKPFRGTLSRAMLAAPLGRCSPEAPGSGAWCGRVRFAARQPAAQRHHVCGDAERLVWTAPSWLSYLLLRVVVVVLAKQPRLVTIVLSIPSSPFLVLTTHTYLHASYIVCR